MSETTYNLKATITLFPTNQGGRKNPVYTGYRPSFAFNTEKYYSGEIKLIHQAASCKDYPQKLKTCRCL